MRRGMAGSTDACYTALTSFSCHDLEIYHQVLLVVMHTLVGSTYPIDLFPLLIR